MEIQSLTSLTVSRHEYGCAAACVVVGVDGVSRSFTIDCNDLRDPAAFCAAAGRVNVPLEPPLSVLRDTYPAEKWKTLVAAAATAEAGEAGLVRVEHDLVGSYRRGALLPRGELTARIDYARLVSIGAVVAL